MPGCWRGVEVAERRHMPRCWTGKVTRTEENQSALIFGWAYDRWGLHRLLAASMCPLGSRAGAVR